MGLDISAYEHVRLVKAKGEERFTSEEYDQIDRASDLTTLYVMPEFSETADGLVTGIYQTSGDAHCFAAGSYSSYNRWRRTLAKLIGTTAQAVWDDPKPGPFVELICNADNEGTIGPVSSAKLARDFAEWQERADAFIVDKENGDHYAFAERYADWRKAFELASHGGAVCLH